MRIEKPSFFRLRLMNHAAAQAQTRFSLLLIVVFSTIAALLAGVGLYGVLATSVRQLDEVRLASAWPPDVRRWLRLAG
jgi:hypothetical protein